MVEAAAAAAAEAAAAAAAAAAAEAMVEAGAMIEAAAAAAAAALVGESVAVHETEAFVASIPTLIGATMNPMEKMVTIARGHCRRKKLQQYGMLTDGVLGVVALAELAAMADLLETKGSREEEKRRRLIKLALLETSKVLNR